MNNSGRKIKRTKKLYGNKRKNKAKSIFTVIITLLIAALLIFLGYSIGDPLMNFFKNLSSSSSDTTPWTPPEVTVTDLSSEESITEEKHDSKNNSIGYVLSVNDILTKDALDKALNNVKENNFTSVVIPLKIKGGEIYYNSAFEPAKKSGAVKSQLTLNEITEMTDKYSLYSIAQINILNDNIAPNADKMIAYQFADGTSSWYDNKPENGGKKWISPFSQEGKEYIYGITNEILNSDFDAVICSDLIFPEFRNSDLGYIGEIVQNPERYKALVNIINYISLEASSKGKKIFLEVSSYNIINNSEEVFKPEMLNDIDFILNYDLYYKDIKTQTVNTENLTSQNKFMTIFQNIKSLISASSQSDIYPYFTVFNDIDEREFSSILNTLNDLDIHSYYIGNE